MHRLIIILFSLTLHTASPTIFITLVDADQQPMVAQRVTFNDESRQFDGSCVTNEAGTCEIPLAGLVEAGISAEIPAPLIRGQLSVQPNGIRPVIWPADENVAITIVIDEAGQPIIPTHGDHADEHAIEPIVTVFSQPTIMATPIETVVEGLQLDEVADIDAAFSAENETSTVDTQPIERAIWPMALCSGIFVLLWGGAVAWIYRRQPA